MTYFVVDRALLPAKDILAGLNRLARGDLSCRLPAFHLAELNRISEVFNVLSEDLRQGNGGARRTRAQADRLRRNRSGVISRENCTTRSRRSLRRSMRWPPACGPVRNAICPRSSMKLATSKTWRLA